MLPAVETERWINGRLRQPPSRYFTFGSRLQACNSSDCQSKLLDGEPCRKGLLAQVSSPTIVKRKSFIVDEVPSLPNYLL